MQYSSANIWYLEKPNYSISTSNNSTEEFADTLTFFRIPSILFSKTLLKLSTFY